MTVNDMRTPPWSKTGNAAMAGRQVLDRFFERHSELPAGFAPPSPVDADRGRACPLGDVILLGKGEILKVFVDRRENHLNDFVGTDDDVRIVWRMLSFEPFDSWAH
jgi:hypothetical protein